MASLATIFSSLQKGLLKRVLEGAGLTLGTSAVLLISIQTAIDSFRSSLGQVSSALLGLAGLAGFHIAFSIILGAIVTRYVQNTTLQLRKK